jgi:hypothetical protein
MAESVFKILKINNLNIQNLRSQSYDSGSNMSGLYSGLQAKINILNSLTKFIPCTAHSLNLVGMNSMSCCNKAVYFFDLLQKILNASVKSLAETRWSAIDDACKSLNENWSSIINALNIMNLMKKKRQLIEMRLEK